MTDTEFIESLEKGKTNFAFVQFYGVNLSWLNLKGLDFAHASFRYCILANSRFTACDFANTDFGGAEVSRTTFTACHFMESEWRRATLTDVQFARPASMIEADFRHADLLRVDFSGVKLDGSFFRDAVIKSCNFDSAGLDHVDFWRARVVDTPTLAGRYS